MGNNVLVSCNRMCGTTRRLHLSTGLPDGVVGLRDTNRTFGIEFDDDSKR